MKQRKSLLILLLLLALSACTQPTAAPSATAVPTHTRPSPTVTPDVITPTQTITLPTTTTTPEAGSTMQPTSTETAIITSEIPDQAHLEYNCLEINPNPPANGLYSGVIVLTAYRQPTQLLDLSTGNVRLLLEDGEQLSYAEAVSLDRKWLAYKILEPAQIVVVSMTDEQAPIRISWEENWVSLVGWLNNQTLLVSGEGDFPNKVINVINPFSGEQFHVISNFPEYNGDPGTWCVIRSCRPGNTLHVDRAREKKC